jgi:NADPH:quinone reductase-like Zn-dependent oxidoreductase
VKKPNSITHTEAASVPLVGITAVMMLEACGLKIGSKSNARVLVLGGAGGVGSVAIQIAKAMFGASFVVTTASKGRKETLVKSLGADLVIDYRSEKFEMRLASPNDESKLFDAILDCTFFDFLVSSATHEHTYHTQKVQMRQVGLYRCFEKMVHYVVSTARQTCVLFGNGYSIL